MSNGNSMLCKECWVDFGEVEPNDLRIRVLKKQIFYMWMFIASEGLWEDAQDFMCERMDEPTPFYCDL